MCGRARCILRPEEVAKEAGVPTDEFFDADKYAPVENLGPGRFSPVICGQTMGGKKRRLQAMKWGLVPSFTKPNAIPDHFVMFNARSENLQERPAFRRLVYSKRCVVLCNGFYEWQQVDKNQKQPYYLYKSDGIMKLAGLYDKWVDAKGEVMYTYTVLTTDIAPGLKWLHTRMPVILTDEGAERWLSDAKFEDLKDLLHSFVSPSLLNHPVDKKVGSTRFQSEECSKKVDIKHAGDIKNFFGAKVEKREHAHFNDTFHVHEKTPMKKEKESFKDAIKAEEQVLKLESSQKKSESNTGTTPTKRQRSGYSSPSPKKIQKTTNTKKSTPPIAKKGTLHAYFQPLQQ